MTLKHEICGRCGKQVYHAEKKVAINKVWHQFCFNCVICHKLLNPSNFSTHRGELYCQQCYCEATSYEIDFGGQNKVKPKISSPSRQSNLSSNSKEDLNSVLKRSEIIETSNVRPSEIKSTLRKRRKDIEQQPNEETIDQSNSLQRRNRSNEDTAPAQFYNRKRRNAICKWESPFESKEDTSSKYYTACTKEESQQISCETTHSTFPRRSSNKNTSKEDVKTNKSKRRKEVFPEEQEDSAYETEHNITPNKTNYKKFLPSFLCKGEDCTCTKNAGYSEFVYEDLKTSSPKKRDDNNKNKPQKNLEKRRSEEMYETAKTDSFKKQKSDEKSSINEQKEEIIFISESGTTKIVKITKPKKMDNGPKKLQKSKINKEDKNQDSLKNNKTFDSYTCKDTTCTIKDTSKKMKKTINQEKSDESLYKTAIQDKSKQEKKNKEQDKLKTNEEIELKRKKADENLHTSKVKESKIKNESDESLYKTAMTENSKKDKRNKKEDAKTCNKTTCTTFKEIKQHQSEDSFNQTAVTDKKSHQKMKKSKTVEKDKSDESTTKPKKDKKIKSQESSCSNICEDTNYTIKDTSKKMKKTENKEFTAKNSPIKMKQNKTIDQYISEESLYKTAINEKNSPQKLKKPCINSTCQTDTRTSSQKMKKRKNSDESLNKTANKDILKKSKNGKSDNADTLYETALQDIPETPEKKKALPIFNKFRRKTKEDDPNKQNNVDKEETTKQKENSKKHHNKSSKLEYSNDLTQERRSSLKKISSNGKTKSQLSFEDQSKPHKPFKLTKKKSKQVVSSKHKDELDSSCSDCCTRPRCLNKSSKSKKKHFKEKDSISSISSDHSSTVPDKYSKSKSDKKAENKKTKEMSQDTTLIKSKKDKQNKIKSKNETMKANDSIQKEKTNEDTFNPVLHSTPKTKKKPKLKGDEYASVDDFFKPVPYSNPKGDHLKPKKKHGDETEESLPIYQIEKNKETSKKNKKVDKSKEKSDKHKKNEETLNETEEKTNKNKQVDKSKEDSSKQKRDKHNKKQEDKMNEDETEENLYKTDDKPKSKKNKKADKSEEKPDKNTNKQEPPEKKKGCKNPNCKNKPKVADNSIQNKSNKEDTTLYNTATSSPGRGFFSFSSRKEDSHQTAGGTPDKTKQQSSREKTKDFEDTTKHVSSKRSSRERKNLQSKPDDLGSIEDLFQPMKHPTPKTGKKKGEKVPKENTSEEELFTTAYNIYPSTNENRNIKYQTAKSRNRRNKSNYDEIPYHTALKYSLPNDKEDLFLKIKTPQKRLTFDEEVCSAMQFFKAPRRSASTKKISKLDSTQIIKKPYTSRNPERRKSSGECKMSKSDSRCNQSITRRKNEEKFCVTAEISPKTNQLNKKTSKLIKIPANKRNIEDVFKSSFAKNILESGKQENRESLLQKLRKKLFSHCQKHTGDLKKKIVRRQSGAAKKLVKQPTKQTVSKLSESSSSTITLRGGNGLYNRAKVVDRFYETCLPDENEELKKEFCRRCSKKVYVVERKFAANGIFHNRCFCCYICQRRLDSLNIIPRKGEIFCKQCYMKYYGPHIYGYGMSPNLHFN